MPMKSGSEMAETRSFGLAEFSAFGHADEEWQRDGRDEEYDSDDDEHFDERER